MEVTLAVRTETGMKEQPVDSFAAGVTARPQAELSSMLEQAAIRRKPVNPCMPLLTPSARNVLSGVQALGTTQIHQCSSSILLSLFFKD